MDGTLEPKFELLFIGEEEEEEAAAALRTMFKEVIAVR
jgi:hypothetical protein